MQDIGQPLIDKDYEVFLGAQLRACVPPPQSERISSFSLLPKLLLLLIIFLALAPLSPPHSSTPKTFTIGKEISKFNSTNLWFNKHQVYKEHHKIMFNVFIRKSSASRALRQPHVPAPSSSSSLLLRDPIERGLISKRLWFYEPRGG